MFQPGQAGSLSKGRLHIHNIFGTYIRPHGMTKILFPMTDGGYFVDLRTHNADFSTTA